MKIAIAIPTYNGLEHLKVLLGSIDSQINIDKNLFSVVVSNVDSNDGTYEFLESAHDYGFDFVVSNKCERGDDGKFIRKGPLANYLNMVKSIPADVDWVWTMGDDDVLVSNSALEIILKLISTLPENSCYINVIPKKRSGITNQVFSGPLFSLCNRFGWNEVFGWISSRICRHEDLQASVQNELLSISQKYLPVPAYEAEILLYSQLAFKDAVVFDSGLVDTQEIGQSDASIKRWQEVDRGDGYFTSLDLFRDFHDLGKIPNTNLMFWRYLSSYWWDKLKYNIAADVLNNKITHQQTVFRLNQLKKIAAMIEDPASRILYNNWLNLFSEKMGSHFDARNLYAKSQSFIVNDLKQTEHPFKYNVIV